MSSLETFEKYFVLDTNIILSDAKNILKISQNSANLIILPETVLDEIDSKKSGFEEINFQAREFARLLEGCEILSTKIINEVKIVRVFIKDISQEAVIDIISKEHFSCDAKNVASNIYNDRKILELSEFSNQYYPKKIVFLSLDVMARIRAISLDINAKSLVGNDNSDFEFEYVKNIEIDFERLEFLNNSSIYEFDTEYKPYNFSYCFKIKYSDQMVLASIANEKIVVLDEDDLREQVIVPLNKEQLFFSHALLSPSYNVLIVEALAGSGKTLLALSAALKLVKKKEYQKIIYIRNSIESLDKGEDVGYLPGLEEKFRIYNHPLMDSLNYIVRSEHKKKKNAKPFFEELEESEISIKVDMMIKTYGIETMWVGEMRGRTLSNSFIIVDEAQNMSNKTMQMVLSRVDNSCKVIVLGSNLQIDNFYVNKYTNALTTLLKSTKSKQELVNIFAIKLKKVLRGTITQWAEDIFSSK
ncbi:MAG: PhoH family protein [Arcobacteraceae bacterium]|nr:PhoH family protein [Arcobacteraceae bacterium]MDY0326711.1 PhoH family protein [Arcobacteraceae bacterium]